jgi:hypothetical protein
MRLRPHHLLCLLTYVGKGYSPAFTDNLDQITLRLAGGEALELVPGPDDICAALLRCGDGADPIDAALPSPPHCLAPSVSRRDEQALRSLNAHLPQPLHIGSRLVLDAALLQRLRGLFARGEIRQACLGCEWHGLCTAVAASGYVGVRLPCVASPPASA